MGARRGPASVLVGVVLAALLTGCGSGSSDPDTSQDEPDVHCDPRPSQTMDPPVGTVDIDGDGTKESIRYHASTEPTCGATVSTDVRRLTPSAGVVVDQPPTKVKGVRVGDRPGDLILLIGAHPRGGFQADLIGYADDKLVALRVDSRPLFEFVATDSAASAVTAYCDGDGIVIVRAGLREGQSPTWAVERTTYSIDGNDVAEVARDILDDRLTDTAFQQRYPELVANRLFENCDT